MNKQTDNKLIEVKVKHLDNVMMNWEATPSATIQQDELPTIKRFLAQHHSICEIRWNYVGSLQGHYESVG